MRKFVITESMPLKGEVRVSGAKNAALPIMAASLLSSDQSIIEEIPFLKDVRVMCDLLKSLGVAVDVQESMNRVVVNPHDINNTLVPYELVNKMRASFLLAGPLLARAGTTRISMPGGCPIGSRPIDLHLKGFIAMGAEISKRNGYIQVTTRTRLKGASIYLDFPSVGATENIMMAAVLAQGQTIIENAAIEPEIVDLAACLASMGAEIKGAGTHTIKINGVRDLKGANHVVIPDRIEAGTFMVAAAITGGDVVIENIIPEHLKLISTKLREAGAEVSEKLTSIRVNASDRLKAVDIITNPYPGFPTDMQAQIASLASRSEGTSIIEENIFENRFMYVDELNRMGANIKVKGRSAIVEGKRRLTGTQVKATDLRAGAALILAGLAAEGTTEITDTGHIERGYLRIDEKLSGLGANIKCVEE